MSVLLNGDTHNPDCQVCGGTNPPDGKVGHGWIEAPTTNVILPNVTADGPAIYLPPQLTVQPCSGCRVTTARRWRRGHYPCPQRDRRTQKPCRSCLRDLGVALSSDDEHLPVNDPPPDAGEGGPLRVVRDVVQSEFNID